MENQYVIIGADRAGVFAGTLTAKDNDGMAEALLMAEYARRRLYRDPKEVSQC